MKLSGSRWKLAEREPLPLDWSAPSLRFRNPTCKHEFCSYDIMACEACEAFTDKLRRAQSAVDVAP